LNFIIYACSIRVVSRLVLFEVVLVLKIFCPNFVLIRLGFTLLFELFSLFLVQLH